MIEQAQAGMSSVTLSNLQEKIATATIRVFQQQANRKFTSTYGHGQTPLPIWLVVFIYIKTSDHLSLESTSLK